MMLRAIPAAKKKDDRIAARINSRRPAAIAIGAGRFLFVACSGPAIHSPPLRRWSS
jgi:hypothetical protein